MCTKLAQLPACSRGALLPLSRSASELTRAQGRAQDVLPGHPETPECHLNTLKGRRTTKTECHCVSLQESNNKRQRLKNSNFLKFHNHQFATKLRSNTWTSKYAKLSLGTWSQMNTPGFSHKRLITPWWILEKEAWLTCELTRKRLPKTSIFDALPLWKATGSSESNVHLTAWQFLSQRMRHFCSLGTQSSPPNKGTWQYWNGRLAQEQHCACVTS